MEADCFAVAMGPRLLPYGASEFTLTILQSEENSGHSMLLGVVEDTSVGAVPVPGRCYGLGPWNGKCFSFPDACRRAAS